MLNNKGQIAETITWVVATVIIVVTLVIFVFISISVSNAKDLNPSNMVSKVGDFWINDEVGELDRFKIKTTFALSLNEKNKEKIEEWINE